MVEAVIIAKEGRIGVCIDICLEMSSGLETPAEQGNNQPRKSEEIGDLLGIEGEDGIGHINLNDNEAGKRSSEVVDLMS